MIRKNPTFFGYCLQYVSLFFFTLFFVLTLIWSGNNSQAGAAPLDEIASDTRCPVCGMFVAKYDVWITQIRTAEDVVFSFDGVKDMMAFLFSPESFGDGKKHTVSEIWVKDYYSLKWVAAEEAHYVAGSDVHGPMGHEMIPFSSRAAAESFMSDHKGKSIYAYTEITADLIDMLRSGHKMKK